MSRKIALSVESMNGFQSFIDPRFGRAYGYVIVDVDTNSLVAELDNKSRDAAQGAGTGAAAMMASNSVEIVISGRFGPKAFQALNDLGIEMRTVSERITVKEAVDRFVSGKLDSETNQSNGQGMGQGGGRGMGQGGGRGMGQGGGRGMGQGGGRGMGQGGGRGMGRGRGMGKSGGSGKGKGR